MSDLDRLFHPTSVAVTGISHDPSQFGGANWVSCLMELGFEGKIYPISRSLSEFKGLKVYPTIEEVPGGIDLVVASVPAKFVPELIRQCVRKGVGFAEFFSAGFSEAGGDGVALEKEVIEIAHGGRTRIVGPNCMGIYCPGSRFAWRLDLPRETGDVAFLSQSGWNALHVIKLGQVREVRFSKVVSYGNAADLNESDFLKYFTADEETKVICAYVEGVKDGQRFIRALKQAAQSKPIIVLKGGRSQSGARAALSHTASLTGMSTIWRSLLRQAGAIEVLSFEELIDTALAFAHLSSIKGSSVALIGSGGGTGVVGADECERVGLTVPALPEHIVRSLSRFIPQEGTSIQNPLDLPFGQSSPDLREAMTIVESCPQIDCLIVHLETDTIMYFFGEEEFVKTTSAVVAATRDRAKPVAVVLRTSASPEVAPAVLKQQAMLTAAGIPVYPSIGRAARAIRDVLWYKALGFPGSRLSGC